MIVSFFVRGHLSASLDLAWPKSLDSPLAKILLATKLFFIFCWPAGKGILVWKT